MPGCQEKHDLNVIFPSSHFAQPSLNLTTMTCLHMHDASTRWTTEIPQSNRIVDTSGHERVVRRRHLQADYSLRVTLEVSEELVVVQGKVSTIVTK